MTNQEFANYLGLTIKDNVFVGEKDGYYFSVAPFKMGFISTLSIVFVFSETLPFKQFRSFSKVSQVLYGTFQKKNDSIIIVLPKQTLSLKDNKKYIGKCTSILNKALEVIKAQNLKQISSCFICGKSDTEESVLTKKVFRDFYVPVHEDCAVQLFKEAINEVKENETKTGRLGIGILFSIIGAFVGLIPTILSVTLANYFIGYLFALIPLGGFFGYKLAKAPMKKYMTSIIVFVSLFLVIGFIFSYYSYLATTPELGFSSLGEMLAYENNIDFFIQDFVISLLFTGLGIWISWKKISSSTNENKVKAVQGLRK